MNIKLTVFFEDPFWVGIFEHSDTDGLRVARVVFGSEPKDYEVYEFILKRFQHIQFSRPVENLETEVKKINPKRIQREVNRELGKTGIGTKAQQAIKLEQETRKVERKKFSKEYREKLENDKFLKKQEKKKEKKKGH